MKVELRFLSGARAGQVQVLQKAYIGLGRHPLSDARFDADRDLDVSSRHAAIVHRGDQFILRDLQSKNGTLLNGKPIAGDVVLKDGDVIGFGAHGPTVEFQLLDAGSPEPPPAVRASAERMSAPREQYPAVAAPGRPPVSAAPARADRGSTAFRIAAEVQRQTRDLRRTTKLLLLVLLLVAAGFGWAQWHSTRNARDLLALQVRADSLNQVSRQLATQFEAELAGLRRALASAEQDAARLRRELAQAGAAGDTNIIARLRNRLDSADARQRGLAGAVAVDYRAIARNNVDAVAIVIVKFSDSEIVSGTGFAVDSNGTLVTNKHVLVGEAGDRQPREIAVKFSGSTQWFRARLVGVAPAADLGIVHVPIRGGTPRVLGVARGPSPERGDPVAIIGYPLGEDLPMDAGANSAIADPTLTVGTVSKVLRGLMQLDGYGAPGSSGSPVFDREGRVVGVLYGGEREAQGKIVYAVPGPALVDLLRTLGVATR
ncbi:MAG TPA: trypsin-like peptidase domain-containing protein [Gemmatimonadales bacterium]|nr:trypsin-like peptidase domain-containing protein [Gemmatimonadales bacterium]